MFLQYPDLFYNNELDQVVDTVVGGDFNVKCKTSADGTEIFLRKCARKEHVAIEVCEGCSEYARNMIQLLLLMRRTGMLLLPTNEPTLDHVLYARNLAVQRVQSHVSLTTVYRRIGRTRNIQAKLARHIPNSTGIDINNVYLFIYLPRCCS